MKILFNKRINILTGLVLVASSVIFFASNTSAAPVVGFEAGRIIDDFVFTNSQSMNVSQIQAFLNSKVPVCDNWGTNGTTSTSRRDYFNSKGYPLPLTCLKDYKENNKSSAQIIYDTAQEFNINPQIIIVLLQKEQGLVTDDWPDPTQYRSATGYGCPDTAACDSQYYGFTNQVRWSSRMFRAILNDSPTWYTPYELGNNYIQYNPDQSCGGSVVNIQNRSTQALYNYTPYQPNASALNAGYGEGDWCGAYGNRNFYQFFKDWFGSTSDRFGYSFLTLASSLSSDSESIIQGVPQKFSFLISNSSNLPVVLGEVFVMVRGPQGQNLDITSDKDVAVPANGSYTFSKPWQSPFTGEHKFTIATYKPPFGYNFVSPASNDTSIKRHLTMTVKPSLRITSNLSVNPEQPIQNNPYTASFSIRNDSSQPMDIGYPFISVRGPQGQVLDVGIENNNRITIPANSTYNYSRQWNSSAIGLHTLSILSWIPEKNQILIIPTDTNINRTATMTIKPSLR